MTWEPDLDDPEHHIMGVPFRVLDDGQAEEFISYALQNDPPDMDQWEVYHPLCRQVWTWIGKGPSDGAVI